MERYKVPSIHPKILETLTRLSEDLQAFRDLEAEGLLSVRVDADLLPAEEPITDTTTTRSDYPAGRAHKATGTHRAWIDRGASGYYPADTPVLRATSDYLTVDPLPLPSADPVSVVTLDERGVSVSDTLPTENG